MDYLKGALVLTYVYIYVCIDALWCTGFRVPARRLRRKTLFLFLGSHD